MTKCRDKENISSAEMTAYWRSQEPEISSDHFSADLVSEEGICAADQVIQLLDYPLVVRKLTIRARFFYEAARKLLQTGRYDSCISLASGFSMLTYYLASSLTGKNMLFFDTDLAHMLQSREQRITSMIHKFDASILNKLQNQALDLEAACYQGQTLQSLFPSCKQPLFIVEGILYFLSKNCVNWLMDNISSYDCPAIIFDYWSEDSCQQSACFNRAYHQLSQNIAEDTKSFWTSDNMDNLSKIMSTVKVYSINEAEQELSELLSFKPLLINPDEFFPLKIAVAS